MWTTEDRNLNMNLKTQFALHISETPVTLKQCQGHQIYKGNMGLNHGYNHAKFERSCFHGVWDKGKIKALFQQENMSIIFLEHGQKSIIVEYSWSTWYYQQLHKVSS